MRKDTKTNRIGESLINKWGSKMTIIDYEDTNNITVIFENGYKIKNRYAHFKDGKIKSPYDKSLYNIGYLGEGAYKPKDDNDEITIQYDRWRSMLKRCYEDNSLKKYPTYIGCEVCKEWHNFQVFAKWFDDNYYECNNERMEVDKDILHKGNKIYSPENCILTPHRINSLFIKSDKVRGDYPIGVDFKKSNNKFQARCNMGNCMRKHLGYFKTPEEAFYKGYKPFKEQYIKQVADEYKELIPVELYNAMYRYEVEVTD